jgi:aspartate-semialdehyde dehydrogenase
LTHLFHPHEIAVVTVAILSNRNVKIEFGITFVGLRLAQVPSGAGAAHYNDEETKVIKETRKIFEDERIAIGATCVRVPVLRAHCEAITFECEKPISEHEVRAILSTAPGVRIVDDRARNYFPMPVDASGQDDVLVGRIRKDLSDPSGHSISMFVAADQLLKGAALNAIQIAELLPERVMIHFPSWPGWSRPSTSLVASL